jgi:hypothetical protein
MLRSLLASFGLSIVALAPGSSSAANLTTLVTFNYANGAYPFAGLIVDANGTSSAPLMEVETWATARCSKSLGPPMVTPTLPPSWSASTSLMVYPFAGIHLDEPTSGYGSGNLCPDAEGVGTATARIRVERSDMGDGRVYHIGFAASDSDGNICSRDVTACAPHDSHDRDGSCIDEGPLYDSTKCSVDEPQEHVFE